MKSRLNTRTNKISKEISTAIKDAVAGKNMSPRFTTASDAIAWLKK